MNFIKPFYASIRGFMWILIGYALIAPWRSLAQPVLPPGITARFYTTFQNANPLDSVIVTGLWDTVSTYRFPAAPAGLSVRGRINSAQTSILELKPFSTLGHFKVWLDFAHIAKLEFNDTAIVQFSLDQGATWTRLLGAPCRYLGTSVSFPQTLANGGSRFHQQSYPADWLAGGNLGAAPQASWWKQERFDMSPFVSNQADVRIRFLLKDGNNNGLGSPTPGYGWLVDSILVTSAFSEIIPPLITHTALTGLQFNINQTFSATIRDSLGCDSTGIDTMGVHLFYRINSGALDSVRMLRQGSTLTWSANLDSTRIADGDTVRYLIRALDSSPRRNLKYFPPQANLADSFITYLASFFPTVVHSAPVTGYQFSPGPFVINAQMSDASGIDSAILVYSLNNGPLVTRRMPNVGGINFRDTIFTVDGDSVRYYIEAVDNSPRRFRKKLPDTTAFYAFTASGPPLVEWPTTFQQCDVFLGPVYNLGPFNIPVRLTDGSDIDTAYLHYKVGNGSYQMVGMSRGVAVRDTLARWNFNGASATTIPGGVNAPTPHRGTGTAALVNAPTGSFVLGNAATSSNNSSDSAAGATNFSWNTTQYPAVGSNTVRGVQFNVATTGKRNVKMSFDLYHGATASRFVRLEYSLNGSTWIPYTGTGTDTADLYRANQGGNRWYNNRTADFTAIAGVDNNALFRVRLITIFAPGTAAYAPATPGQTYAQTGALRIDAVTISGENDSYCNWFAQVPAVSDSDTVSYYVRAFDKSVRGNLSVSPSIQNPRTFIALNGLNMPYQDGFEVNNALWSPYVLTGPVTNPVYNPGGWVRGMPGKSILNSAFQGSNAWTVDSLNGNYPNNAFYVLESPVFNFLNSEQSYLNFMQWRAIDSGGVTNPSSPGLGDGFWVEYTRNISVPNWQKLGIYSALPNSAQSNWYNRSSISGLTTSGGWDGRNGGWARSEIRLPDSLFKGVNLGGTASKVRFRMVFRSNGATTSNGVAVDDIQVAMPPLRDVGVQLIASNSSGTLVSVPNNNYQVKGGEPFAVFVRLQNFGLRTILDTVIPVTVRIGSFTQTTQVRLTDSLRPGAVTATALRLDSIMSAPLRWFTLSAYTALGQDGNSSNDSTSVQMYGVPILSVPNNDNFDVLPDNWLQVAMGTAANPWQRGVPTGPQLNAAFSSPNVWGTVLNGNPTSGQGGYVLSPLYNFRNSVNTTLKLRVNRRLGTSGSAFRISYVDELFTSWQTLGQVSDPTGVNWYNSTGTIGGIAGPAWNGNSGSSGGVADFVEHSLELPAQFNYRNNRVRFRLDFQSGFTPSEGVIVDNWAIVPPPAREVGMRQILKPVACPDSLKATDTIRVVIRNYGGDTLFSIPFNYRYDNLPPVLGASPYLYTTPLPPASEATVTLPAIQSPLPPGTYTLKVFTQLTGDARTSNDTITRCIKAIPVNDLIMINNIVPTSAICYPSGLRQLKFRIRNIGHSPTSTFTAGYRIDTLPPVIQNFNRVIQPNAYDTIIINTPANIPNGYTTIRLFVNGGTIDPVLSNDTLAVTLFGREALNLTHTNNFERQGYAPYCDTALSNAVTDVRYTPVPAINNSPDYALYMGTEFSGASFNTTIPLNPWADSWNGTYLSRVVFPVNTANRSNIRIRFKLLQVAGDNAADKRISLLRVVANGRQVGPTLQPLTMTAANNPFQTIDFGLDTCYVAGDPLVIEFQSKCRYRFLPAGTGGSDRNGNFIDDLIIYNSVPNGAEVVEVLYDPPFPTANTPVTAKARIRNNANPTYVLNNINLDLQLNGSSVQNLVVPMTLPFMKDTLYTFSNTFNLNLGSNALCVTSSIPNGLADNFPLDDTACTDAVGFPLIDTFPYCNNFDEGQPAWLTRNPVTLRSSGNTWSFGTPSKGLINGASSSPNAWYISSDSLYKPYDSSALYTPIFQTIKDSCYVVKFKTLWMTDFFANDTTTRPLHGDGGTLEYSTDGGVRWNSFGYLDTLTNEWYNAIVQALAVFNSQQNIVGFGWSGVSPSLYVPMQQIFNTTDNAQVIFRFRFGSDYAFQGEGWSIDDFCFELLPGPCEVVSVPELSDMGLVLSQNFPNPASDLTTVAYYLPKGGKARLELRDLYGRPVWGRSLGLQEGGWYKEGIETASLAQGLYYYTLSFEGRKLTKKLLISR